MTDADARQLCSDIYSLSDNVSRLERQVHRLASELGQPLADIALLLDALVRDLCPTTYPGRDAAGNLLTF